MKKKHALLFALLYLFVTIFLAACGNNSSEKKETAPTKEEKKDTVVKEKKTETIAKRAPIINIMDTVSVKRTVIYMKDSAATYERIGMKLGEIYGFKLAAVIKKTGMKVTGRPMSWHNTQKAPYYFEAGVPVEKKIGKLPSNVYVREMGTDSVTIARFYGPYELLPQAYEALKDIMKGRKKKAKEKIYEIYVDDPLDKDGKMKDPYKVQTDVVFTWK